MWSSLNKPTSQILVLYCLISVAWLHFPVAAAEEEGESEKITALFDWLRNEHSATLGSLTVKEIDVYGRGVVATANIAKGELLFHLPNSAILTEAKHRTSTVGQVFSDELPTNLAALFILAEKFVPHESEWGPYIDALPTHLSTPLFFSDSEINEFQASPLKEYTLNRKSNTEKNYERIFGNNPKTRRPDMRWMKEVKLSDWQWALSIVWSRYFSLGDQGGSALLPLADMFNMLSPTTSSSYVMVTERRDRDGVRFFAAKEIKKAAQIFVTYGGRNPLPNSQLLMDYGFVFEQTPYDMTTLDFEISTDDPSFDKKEDLLEKSRCFSRGYVVLYDRVPSELFCAAKVAALSATDLEALPEAQLLTSLKESQPISKSNEKAAWTSIEKLAATQLGRYPTSGEEDTELLKKLLAAKSASNANVRNVILIRLREKQILASLVTLAQQTLHDLDSDNRELKTEL